MPPFPALFPGVAFRFALMLFCRRVKGGGEVLLWAATIFLALEAGAAQLVGSPEGGARILSTAITPSRDQVGNQTMKAER